MKYSTRSVHSEIVIHKSFIHVAEMPFKKYKQEREKIRKEYLSCALSGLSVMQETDSDRKR